MNTDEILEGLTLAQRKELDEKLRAAAANAAPAFHRDPVKFARVTQAINLKENITLQVTLSLLLGDKGIVHPVIEEITQTSPAN